MDLTFYDQRGQPIAYTSDKKHIWTFVGKAVAYLDDESVYAYSGRHLGWFMDGWIRDHNGDCVFYTEDARGGPVRPTRRVKPVKYAKSMRPMKAVRYVRPTKPIKSNSWSGLSGLDFFS